jgi:hypothetical protein
MLKPRMHLLALRAACVVVSRTGFGFNGED